MIDVAIVGGSFAGLECARVAALQGLDVVLLERKADPGIGVRTTGLLVKEVAEAWDIPRRITRDIHGVRLYAPSLRAIDLECPGYYFMATDTPALLRWMAREAESSGARITYGTDAAAPAARYVVGADGARSSVAVRWGLGRNREFLAGAEAELEGVRGVDGDRVHCFLDAELAPGYIGWVVPGVRATQVGLACRLPVRPRLDAFLRVVSRVFDLSSARVVSRRGGLIPVGGPVRPATREGVVLVGDAAGLVSPLTAGGIHTALDSGRRTAVAIADELIHGGAAAWRELSPPRFFWKRCLRRLMDAVPTNAVWDALLATPPMRALARAVFFHHRGLFSPAAWRDLARALVAN